jgi:cyd operon protein YbgT
MWYFAWILGVLLACAFGIINVLWLEAQESLEQDSVVLDPLTKTLIRFEFLGILKEKITQSQFERRPFCLLMMGLGSPSGGSIASDGDKGDRIRLDYSGLIRGVLPKQNTILARYDACTFAAILSNIDARAAESFAERLCGISQGRKAVSEECATISIGITECRRDFFKSCNGDVNPAFKILLENADKAMQEARSQGDNRHVTIIGEVGEPSAMESIA